MDIKSFSIPSNILEKFSQISEKTTLTKEQLCTSLVNVIELNIGNEDFDTEIFLSNYVYMCQIVIGDLFEIDKRLVEIQDLDKTIPSSEDYTHRKLRYFSELNKKARDEIIIFLTRGLPEFLTKNKKLNFAARQNNGFLNLELMNRYKYSVYKKYYDYKYDFSIEAKIRFIPSETPVELLDKIKGYIQLKNKNFLQYKVKLSSLIRENDMLAKLRGMIEAHNVTNKRLEIFDTMENLYSKKKWQSFISLAILQIEGLFYDYCKILNEGKFSGNAGTLVEKVDKSLKDNHIIKLSVYPYYIFDIPVLRNEIAHTGMTTRDDLEHLANELILDLNTVISWIYKRSHGKYATILMISDAIDKQSLVTPEDFAVALLTEMMSCMGVVDFDYINFLKNPELFSNETEFMKFPDGYLESIAQKISSIIKTKEFWMNISEHIDTNEVFDYNKSYYNIFVLADKLKNAFIPILAEGSPEKIACKSVDEKIRKCKNNMN